MAVLEKIRVQMGIFITVLIAIALLSFIVDPTTLQSALSMFSSKNDVGSMNGTDITYMEYSQKLEANTNLQQVISGNSSMDEQAQENASQTTWQSFLKKLVFMPAFNEVGIALGSDELYDMAQGNYISPVLSGDPVFLDENRAFDKTKVATFLQAKATDQSGVYTQYWDFLEDNMETERLFSKYASLLQQSTVLNAVEVRKNMEESNQTSNVRFYMAPISFTRDSTITVSDAEVEEYYNNHKQQYKQQASRDIEYVVFPIVPSMDDVNKAQADAEKVFPEFEKAENLRQFLARNSDKPLDTYYYKQGELTSLSAVLDSFAFNATTKDVLPLFLSENTYRAARIVDIKQMPDSVFVNHILIQRATEEEGMRVADSVVTLLNAKPERFAELATELSADRNTSVLPGEIGWFTQNYLIPGMESVFDAPINKPYVQNTQYGIHVVKVSQRTTPLKKVQLAVLVKEAVAGKETYQTIYSQANTLSTTSKNVTEFNDVASANNWYPVPARGIAEDAKTISGYENMREMTRWAFGAKYGEVSEVISVDNKYFFVACVTGIHEEGTATLSERRAEITQLVTLEKKKEKLYAQMQEEIKGYSDIAAWAEATGKNLSTQNGLAFGTVQQSDPTFVGAVCGAPEKQLCGPVKGEMGVYVFQVDERNDGAYYTEQDAATRKNYLSNIQIQMVNGVLQEAANVEDHRAKFF